MSELAIRVALLTQLALVKADFPTAFENETFNATPEVAYQRVYVMPAEPLDPDMGNKLAMRMGILQVTLCYQKSEGIGDALAHSELFLSFFKRSVSLVSGGVTVTISGTPEVSQGRAGDTHYELPVRIRYHANIINP